jgi:hypothetical protein
MERQYLLVGQAFIQSLQVRAKILRRALIPQKTSIVAKKLIKTPEISFQTCSAHSCN